MGDYEEAHLVYMCNTFKQSEKNSGTCRMWKITQKPKICSHTKLSHSFREREREKEREREFKKLIDITSQKQV